MLIKRRCYYGGQSLCTENLRNNEHYPSCRTFVSTLSAVHYSRENRNRSHVRRPTAIRKTLLSKVIVSLLGLILASTGIGAEVVVPSSSLAASGVYGSRQRQHSTMALDSATASKTKQKSNDKVGSALSYSYKNNVDSEEDVIVDHYGETTQEHEDYDTTTEEDASSDDPAPLSSSQREGTEDGVELEDSPDSVRVCVVTWNLAELSPPARDVEFIRRVSRESDIVAVGVQEIENLKPRRHEGGRTREWRRLLIRILGKDFVRVGHHAMGAVQLTLFARREMFDRVKVIKLTDVVCGVGNVLQNKGGIGAFLRVDRTTFLFIAAHLAAHQTRTDERNADYWRIATTLDQEIPPAWVTHAARKRAKRTRLVEDAKRQSDRGATPSISPEIRLQSKGPFQDRVDRVFFFGDLNYRVDLSREDLQFGFAVEDRGVEGDWEMLNTRKNFGMTYPGTGDLDPLLDFDQLTFARGLGNAFGGFSEARVKFYPTYKFDKGTSCYDTSHKMRPPAWTDRILFAPAGPQGVSSLEYDSVPESRHSDHRPVYATFIVRLED